MVILGAGGVVISKVFFTVSVTVLNLVLITVDMRGNFTRMVLVTVITVVGGGGQPEVLFVGTLVPVGRMIVG